MNFATHWASSEESELHWVEPTWEELQSISCVQILWAKCWGHYFNSKSFEGQVWQDNQWLVVYSCQENEEKMHDICVFEKTFTQKVRVVQNIHGGSPEYPSRD